MSSALLYAFGDVFLHLDSLTLTVLPSLLFTLAVKGPVYVVTIVLYCLLGTGRDIDDILLDVLSSRVSEF